MMRKILLISLLLLLPVQAKNDAYLRRFDQAWRLVAEFYYDLNYRGVDWQAVGRRYRSRVASANSWREVYRLLDEMYGELGDDHSSVLSPAEARDALRGAMCYPLPFPVPPEEPSVEEEKEFSPTTDVDDKKPWGSFEYSKRGNVGYLKLPNLIDGSIPDDLADAVRGLEKQGVKGYVLDLRDNPGGLALVMAEVAGVFMHGLPWRIVTRTKGVMPQPTIPFWGKPLTSKPLVVIVNGGVNSAAEGLAGALKRAHRARILGERTAGNTEVVLPYCFPDGGVAMLASGVLAPVGGPTWEGRGVEPDIVVKNEKEQLARALRLIEQGR